MRRRLLVVEDSNTMAKLLSVVWDAHDVRLVTDHFPDLRDPTDPRWHGIDMLITDLDLQDPDVDGLDLLRTCETGHPLVHRGLLSGSLESPRFAEARRVAHVVLPKPTELDELIAAVEAF